MALAGIQVVCVNIDVSFTYILYHFLQERVSVIGNTTGCAEGAQDFMSRI